MKSINTQTVSDRQNQYDILRIFSMIAVVSIHACTSQTNYFQQLILMIAGTAVPIFFFLSGSFLLSKYNVLNNLKKYYIKRCFKIFVPLIFFEIIYFIYALIVHGPLMGVDLRTEFLVLVNRLLTTGIPGTGYHLWFMNVIIPFYVIAPILILLRKRNIKTYCILTIAWLIFSECNFYFSLVSFPWYLSFIDYVPFIMLGDILKNIILPKENSKYIYIFLIVFVICIVAEMIMKMSLINGAPIGISEFILHDATKSFVVVDPNTQQIINLLASVALFSFYYSVKVEKNYSRLADFCFYIYLIHFVLEEVCMYAIRKAIIIFELNIATDAWFMIIIRTLMVLIVASICIYILNKFCNLIFKKELF